MPTTVWILYFNKDRGVAFCHISTGHSSTVLVPSSEKKIVYALGFEISNDLSWQCLSYCQWTGPEERRMDLSWIVNVR